MLKFFMLYHIKVILAYHSNLIETSLIFVKTVFGRRKKRDMIRNIRNLAGVVAALVVHE